MAKTATDTRLEALMLKFPNIITQQTKHFVAVSKLRVPNESMHRWPPINARGVVMSNWPTGIAMVRACGLDHKLC